MKIVKKQKRNKRGYSQGRRTSGKSPPGNKAKVHIAERTASKGTVGSALAKMISVPADVYQAFEHSRKFEKELVALEKRLHNAEDTMEITVEVLRTACEFYTADWAGVLFVDLEAEVWTAEAWYDAQKGAMKSISIKELEYAGDFARWVQCLKENRPVILMDREEVAKSNPVEYEFYKLVGATSILAVPFWKHPTGFLVLKNPKTYPANSHMLQILAYVAMMSAEQLAKSKSAEHIVRPLEIRDGKDIIINVFGGLEITSAIGTVTQEKLSSDKGCKLLTYLLLSGKAVQPWDIVHTLWPNDYAKDPMSNLRSLIYNIRTKLNFIMEENLIISSDHGYMLNPEYNVISDIARFEAFWNAACETKDAGEKKKLLISAFDLYRGNLLPLSSGEQWCVTESSYYNTIYLKVVKELLHLLNKEHDLWAIREYATRALKIEPGNMEPYKYLVRAVQEAGSSVMAKQELEVAKQNLSEEEYMDLINILNAGKKGLLWSFGNNKETV